MKYKDFIDDNIIEEINNLDGEALGKVNTILSLLSYGVPPAKGAILIVRICIICIKLENDEKFFSKRINLLINRRKNGLPLLQGSDVDDTIDYVEGIINGKINTVKTVSNKVK